MSKAEVFARINSGETIGSIDAVKLQEAYADSDEFWTLLSLSLSAPQISAEATVHRLALQAHCREITDALLDQAIEEQRQINTDAFLADKADDQN